MSRTSTEEVQAPLLKVENLVVSFHTEMGTARAVDNVSFKLDRTKVLGVVGESGCGKSVTALSLIRLLPKPAGHIESGRVLFKGENVFEMPAERLYQLRGRDIAMIFQEPMTALNPVHQIKRQMSEVYQLHFPDMDKSDIYAASLALLRKVGIADPEGKLNAYPHQLSGGIRQRVMIAMALSCRPHILIADEPTTALDVTIQAQILDLIKMLQNDTQMSVIFITHDLGVIADISDDVMVMYGGRIAETGSVKEVYLQPLHPYTRGLMTSIPSLAKTPKTILPTIPGMVPSLFDMPKGCRFAGRCQFAREECHKSEPKLEYVNENHGINCFRWREI